MIGAVLRPIYAEDANMFYTMIKCMTKKVSFKTHWHTSLRRVRICVRKIIMKMEIRYLCIFIVFNSHEFNDYFYHEVHVKNSLAVINDHSINSTGSNGR